MARGFRKAATAEDCCFSGSESGRSSCSSSSSPSSRSSGSHDGTSSILVHHTGVKTGWSPILRERAIIDSEDCTIVMVFTRAQEPGAVDCQEMVQNPLAQGRRIFVHPDVTLDGLSDQPMTVGEYHAIVRSKISELLSASGLRLDTFPSVDRDETFLKLYLDPCGEVVKELAEHFMYFMPLNQRSYSNKLRYITNADGELAFAHVPFEKSKQDKLQPFRRVDVIRIAYLHIMSILNLEELLAQEFIVTHFAAGGFKELERLSKRWWWPLHCHKSLVHEEVRNYFGEKIAFFLHFFVCYVRALFLFGGVACCFWWVDSGRVRLQTRGLTKIGFCGAVCIWALVFELYLGRSITRKAQVWGMKHFRDSIQVVLPGFMKELVGTWRESRRRMYATMVSIVYSLGFILVTSAIKSPKFFGKYQVNKAYAVSGLMVLARVVWSRLAPMLTQLENHKTQNRFDNALIGRLAFFKLFFLIWPPLGIFMLDKITNARCGVDLMEAATKTYGNLSVSASFREPEPGGLPLMAWPKNTRDELNETNVEMLLNGYTLDKLDMFLHRIISWEDSGQTVCLSYCLPQECNYETFQFGESQIYMEDCESNCYQELRLQICTQFLVHVCFTIFFLSIPLLQTKLSMVWEVQNAVRQLRSELPTSPAEGSLHYSFLQVQAKCQIIAPYKYYSWGGSYVEDFLELMLGFAYICVFGMVVPPLIMIAAVTQLFEHFLLSLRMRYITGRPYPEAAEDIGTWATVIVMIGTTTVFVNGYIAAFVVRPMCFWEPQMKILVFLGFGSFFLFLRTVLRNTAPNIPNDVWRIEDYNRDIVQKLTPVQASLTFGKEGGGVDLGLRPTEEGPLIHYFLDASRESAELHQEDQEL